MWSMLNPDVIDVVGHLLQDPPECFLFISDSTIIKGNIS